MEDAPGCHYYLPGLTDELRSKVFNSWPFSPSVGVDQEPVEGKHFYDREITGSAQVPLIKSKPREFANLRIEVEACDADRTLTLTKGSFSAEQPDKILEIPVPANQTVVSLFDKSTKTNTCLHFFEQYRDTYTELSMSLSGPGKFSLKSDFVRIAEQPWPQAEKDAVATALEAAVKANVGKHFSTVNEPYLSKSSAWLKAKPLIYSLDVHPRHYKFYSFPDCDETFAAWLKQVVDTAVDIPTPEELNMPEDMRKDASILACLQYALAQLPDQPAFKEDVVLQNPVGGDTVEACYRVQAITGFTVLDVRGERITTEGKPVQFCVGQNPVGVDIVDGEIKLASPFLSPFAKFTTRKLQFAWGTGGLPADGKGVRVVQHSLHFSSVIDMWFRNDCCHTTSILPFIGDWSLFYENGVVGPLKTEGARQYVIDMHRAREEQHERDMKEAQKRFGHLIAMQQKRSSAPSHTREKAPATST